MVPRLLKIPDGKNATKFGYNSACKDKAFTMHVINGTHDAYVHLKSGVRANTEELSLL
jgi:inorganic pyrophosphatase